MHMNGNVTHFLAIVPPHKQLFSCFKCSSVCTTLLCPEWGLAMAFPDCQCDLATCAECKFRRCVPRWSTNSWVLLAADNLGKGTWLRSGVALDGRWGAGCHACSVVGVKRGLCLVNQRDFVQGTVRTLGTIQQSRFVRHANSKFHKNSCRELLGEDVSAVALAIEKFRQVLNHVVKHGAVVHKGISDNAGAKTLRKMVFCLAEAVKHRHHRYFRDVQSITLLRDARKGRLHIRFVAVDSRLQVRHGFLGAATGFGSGSAAIAKTTNLIVSDFATRYAGMKVAELRQEVRRRVLDRTHMITVDAAADEIVASELMRSGVDGAVLTPNLRIVLRDKAHSTRRNLCKPKSHSSIVFLFDVQNNEHLRMGWVNMEVNDVN